VSFFLLHAEQVPILVFRLLIDFVPAAQLGVLCLSLKFGPSLLIAKAFVRLLFLGGLPFLRLLVDLDPHLVFLQFIFALVVLGQVVSVRLPWWVLFPGNVGVVVDAIIIDNIGF
jgi:hypothetical protein